MVLQLLVYLSILVLLIGIVYKTIRIARMPIHLRWELYPIPHGKEQKLYGGSYFEEINWWTKPLQPSLGNELKEMAREILAIQTLFRNNRALWFVSFPFHLGIYLLTGFIGFLTIGAVFQSAGVTISNETPEVLLRLLHFVTIACGTAGWVLGALGAIGLLLTRTLKPEMRRISVRADYFNLLLLLAVFVSGLVAWASSDRSCVLLRGFVQSLISFKTHGPLPASVSTSLILAAAFLIYLPFTHMTHFIGKYFSFHEVRWQDAPSIGSQKIEQAVTEVLGYRVDWAASHIRAGETWADSAAKSQDSPTQEEP